MLERCRSAQASRPPIRTKLPMRSSLASPTRQSRSPSPGRTLRRSRLGAEAASRVGRRGRLHYRPNSASRARRRRPKPGGDCDRLLPKLRWREKDSNPRGTVLPDQAEPDSAALKRSAISLQTPGVLACHVFWRILLPLDIWAEVERDLNQRFVWINAVPVVNII